MLFGVLLVRAYLSSETCGDCVMISDVQVSQYHGTMCNGNPVSCTVTLQNTGSLDGRVVSCVFKVNGTDQDCNVPETTIPAESQSVVVVCTGSGFTERSGTYVIGLIVLDTGRDLPFDAIAQ